MRLRTLVWTVILALALGVPGRASALPSNQALPSSPESRFEQDSLQWQPVSVGLESPFALWFAPDYASSGRIWAAMDHTLHEPGYGYGAIYGSTDRGVTWQVRSSLQRQTRLAAFAPTGGAPLILALESYYDPAFQPVNRLVRSTTDGASWQTVWDSCPPFSALIFSPNFAADRTVFAVWDNTPAGGLWKSTDGGVTWQPSQRIQVAPTHGHVVSLAFSPAYATDGALYASAPAHFYDGATFWGGLYRSTDRGATWAEVARNGCLDTIVDKVAIAPNAGAGYSIYVLGGAAIYHSGDGGASWNCPAINPQAGGLLDLALSPAFATDRTLVVATGQGLKRSTDGGASWSQAGWAGAPVQRVTLSPAYAQDRTLAVALQDGFYGATHPGGTFFSADNGATWRPAGIARMSVKTIALSPEFAEDQKVWVASGTGDWKAYRSANGGETWLMQHYQAGSADGGFDALAALPATGGPHELYATSPLGGPLAGVYKSVDDGASFSQLDNSPQFGSAVAVTVATDGEKAVWVSNYQGVHRSLNSGFSWTLRNGDLPAGSVVSLAVAAEANTPDTALLFAVLTGAKAGVYRSADSGGHWAKLPLPGGAAAQQVALSPTYAVDHRLWVSTATSGILRSADGGDTWQGPTTVLNGCGPVQVTGEGSSQQLWAACGGRLYTSTDGGVQWAATGPGGLTVATVATSPLTKMVYIGTEGGDGIWRGRPDTSTVVVRDEAGAPVAGAEVYRNGALAGRTAASGVLETPVAAGDQLVARKLLKTEPSKRAYHNPGGGAGWAYRLYITSLAIPATGEPAPAVVSNPQKIQYLTVRKSNTLIGFNLVASVEWDATAQFLEELRQGFALTSRALYDASNGQMLLERVSIFDNSVAIASADVQIRAHNRVWPYASVAGLLCRPERRVTGGHILTGRYFNGVSSGTGAWNQQIAYSMLLHEFGHYGLEVHDSYYYFSPFPQKQSATCTGPEINTNQTPDSNATLMYSLQSATEFSMQTVPGAWAEPCLRTAQYQWDRRSDWETIVAVYQGTATQWKLKTPADYGQVVTGPHVIPVTQWSRAEVAADAQTGICLTAPTLQVIRPDGSPAAGASVLLQRDGRLIDQGVTALDGTITVLGAAPGDLVTFEVLPPLLGAADAAQASTFGVRYIAREAVVCPTSLLPAAGEPERQMAPATVVVQPTAYDVRVQIAPADPSDPQRAALRVQASTTLAAPPTVTWMQIGADGSSHPGLSYDSAAQTYVGTLQLAPAAPVQGVLLVDAVDNQQRKVHTAVNLHLELATTTVDQRIISGDGQAELSIPANSLRGEGQIGWQSQWVDAPTPARLEVVAGPFELRVSPTLTTVEPNFDAASLSLYYVERSASGEQIDVGSLQIFAWDGQQWLAQETTVIEAGKLASAPIPLRNGRFALFGRWRSESQLYLPFVQKE